MLIKACNRQMIKELTFSRPPRKQSRDLLEERYSPFLIEHLSMCSQLADIQYCYFKQQYQQHYQQARPYQLEQQ